MIPRRAERAAISFVSTDLREGRTEGKKTLTIEDRQGLITR